MHTAWVSYLENYLVGRMLSEKSQDKTNSFVSLRKIAHHLQDISGLELAACARGVVGVAFFDVTIQRHDDKRLWRPKPRHLLPYAGRPAYRMVNDRDDSLSYTPPPYRKKAVFYTILFDAAVLMNLVPVVKQLLSNPPATHPISLQDNDYRRRELVYSAVFAAAYNGSRDIISLVIPHVPRFRRNLKHPLLQDAAWTAIEYAMRGGHTDAAFLDYLTSLTGSLGIKTRETPGCQRHFSGAVGATLAAPTLEAFERLRSHFRPPEILWHRKIAEPLPLEVDLDNQLANAVRRGYAGMVAELLARGADPDRGSKMYSPQVEKHWEVGEKGWRTQGNMLWQAVRWRDLDILNTLLAHGAHPDGRHVRKNPLAEAVHVGSVEMASVLTDAGADIDLAVPPAIVRAVRKGDETMFRFLRNRGVRLNTPETGGWAMRDAKLYGLGSMVKLLVAEGVEEDYLWHYVESKDDQRSRCSYGWEEGSSHFYE